GKSGVARVADATRILVHVDKACDRSAGFAEVVVDTPLPCTQSDAAQLVGSRPCRPVGGAVDGADIVAGLDVAGGRAFEDRVAAGGQTGEFVRAVRGGRGAGDGVAARVLQGDRHTRNAAVAGVPYSVRVRIYVNETGEGSAGLAEVVV